MFACDYPEVFSHNVEEEFRADDMFEIKKETRFKTLEKDEKISVERC